MSRGISTAPDGISALRISGSTIEITFKGSVIRIYIEGDRKRVRVDNELFTRGTKQKTKVVVAPEKYKSSHFAEVNKLVTERYYSQESALREIAEKYNFIFENFRRQYYDRGGNKIRQVGMM